MTAMRGEADIENSTNYHLCVAGFVEAALEIKKATTPDHIARAVTIKAARNVEAICKAIGQLLDAFTPQECANYIANAGYAAS